MKKIIRKVVMRNLSDNQNLNNDKDNSKEAPQKLLLEEYILDTLKAEAAELKLHANKSS
jgi:hypothetical protein